MFKAVVHRCPSCLCLDVECLTHPSTDGLVDHFRCLICGNEWREFRPATKEPCDYPEPVRSGRSGLDAED